MYSTSMSMLSLSSSPSPSSSMVTVKSVIFGACTTRLIGIHFFFLCLSLCPYVLQGFATTMAFVNNNNNAFAQRRNREYGYSVFPCDQKKAATTTTTIPPTTKMVYSMILYTTSQTNFDIDTDIDRNNNNDNDNNEDDCMLLCPSSHPSKTFGAPNVEVTYKQIYNDVNNNDNDDNNNVHNNININNDVQMLPLQKYYARKYSRSSSSRRKRILTENDDNDDDDEGSSSNSNSNDTENDHQHQQNQDNNNNNNNNNIKNYNYSSGTSFIFDVCSDIPSLDFIYLHLSRFKHLTKSSRSLLEEYYNDKNTNTTTTTTMLKIIEGDIDDHVYDHDTKLKQQEQERRLRSKIRAECRASLPLLPKSTLRIIYCDSDICVVNKPSGVLSVPGHRRNPSLATLVYDTIQKTSLSTKTTSANTTNDDTNDDNSSIDRTIVHRLDMATSGIIVYALSKEALSKLHAAFRDRVVQKTYIALVEGHLHSPHIKMLPEVEEEGALHYPTSTCCNSRMEGEIDVDMERDLNNPPYMRIVGVVHPTSRRRTNNNIYIDTKENNSNNFDNNEGDRASNNNNTQVHLAQEEEEEVEIEGDEKKSTTETKVEQQQQQKQNHKFWTEAPKQSKTTWSIMSFEYRDGKPVTRLELRPHTGRTHQLRVHCSQGLGAPIVGDDIYGNGGTQGYSTLCLHAQKLCFYHPISGAPMIFEADAPF